MSSAATAKIPPPVSLKTKSKMVFEDDDMETGPATRAGFFSPSRFWIVIATALVAVAVLGVTGLLSNRYELIAAARTENAIVYRIDRLTGHVSLCWPSACVPLVERKEGEGDAASAH